MFFVILVFIFIVDLFVNVKWFPALSAGIDHSVAPPLIGPSPRTDISPLTPGANLLFTQSGKIDHIPLDGNRMIKDESKTVLHVPVS